MNNKRGIIYVIAVVLVGIIVFTSILIYENHFYSDGIRTTAELSDEEILMQSYFDILVPAKENRNLPSDVESLFLGDGKLHVILPKSVSRKSVVCYIRDEKGNSLARRVYNLDDKATIGSYEIVADKPDIPVLYFNADNPGDFNNMIASDTTDVYCDGAMSLCVDEEDVNTKGWYNKYYGANGDFTVSNKAQLKGRGSSSWNCEAKKSFSLILNKSINLLGMGSNKKWNLVGCAYDPSLIKNTTFNYLAKELGIKYQPEMQYVNLFVDGRYQGVYLLTTKVSVSENRVNLSKGDYLYKMDPPSQEQPIYYSSESWFCDGNEVPVADLLYPQNASDTQKEKATALLQRFMDTIDNPNVGDLNEIVDMESLVKYYWIQEAGMNFDAWQRSVYMYYSREDGKMHLGPVWDMDLTLGSPYEKEGMMFDSPEGFRVMYAGWYRKLFERNDFTEALLDSYFDGGVREALLELPERFYKEKNILGEDAYTNYGVFGHSNMGTTINYGDSYDEYCDNMILFYKKRMEWIDKQMQMHR